MKTQSLRDSWIVRRPTGDDGTSLVFVIFVSVVTFLMLITTSNALVTQLRPTKTSADLGAATAAAQAGLQDFVSYLNGICRGTPSNPLPDCVPDRDSATHYSETPISSNAALLSTQGHAVTSPSGLATKEWFYWQIVAPTSGSVSGGLRLRSTGQVLSGKPSPRYTIRSIVADIVESAGYTSFQYYTQYETSSSDWVNNFYPPRSIQFTTSSNLDDTVMAGRNPGVLTWNGVCTYNTATSTCTTATGTCTYNASTNPSCNSHHDSSVCDDYYYDTSGTGSKGRGEDTAWNNTGADARRPSATKQQQMLGNTTTGSLTGAQFNDFAYYQESASYNDGTTTNGLLHDDVCDASFEPNMIMNGPIYSQDAFLVDRGKDTGNSCQSEPNMGGNALNRWNGTHNGTTVPFNTNNNASTVAPGWQRNWAGTNGAVCLTNGVASFPKYSLTDFPLPANADGQRLLARCVYIGPTRIHIVGNVAYVTSPMTPAGAAPCYSNSSGYQNVASTDSSGQATTDGTGGVLNAAVPIPPGGGSNGPIIYVANPTGLTTNQSTYDSPIFKLQSTLSLPSSARSFDWAGASTAWSQAAPYSSTPCPPASGTPTADVTQRRTFDCEVGKLTPPEDVYTNLRNAADAVITGATTDANVQSQLQTQLAAQMKSSMFLASAPGSLNSGDVKYVLTVGASIASAPSHVSPPAFPNPDGFFQTIAGQGYDSLTNSWTVNISRYSCPTGSTCNGNGRNPNPTRQSMLNVNGSRTTVTPCTTAAPCAADTSKVQTTLRFPRVGSQTSATSYAYNDPRRDVSTYTHAVGDIYIDTAGSSTPYLSGGMTVIAEHDVFVTNEIKYSNEDPATTGDGLALVADHNVRVYRPMTCTANGAVGQTSPGFCPNDTVGIFTGSLAPTSNGGNLDANHPATAYTKIVNSAGNYPAIGDGGHLDATIFALRGAFTADNFYRGDQNGDRVTILGGLYQYHRGAVSLPCQGHPYQGCQQKMPGLGITYNYDNLLQGGPANPTGGTRVPFVPNPTNHSGNGGTWSIVSISSSPN